MARLSGFAVVQRKIVLTIAIGLATTLAVRASADIAWAYDDPNNDRWNYSGHDVQPPDYLRTRGTPFASRGSIPVSTKYSVYGDDSIKLKYEHHAGGHWIAYIPTDGQGNPPSVSPWSQPGWNVSGEVLLRFYVLPRKGEPFFSVKLIDANGYGSAPVDVGDYVENISVWQLVAIPTSDLFSGPGADPDFDPTHVRFVAFANSDEETDLSRVFIDKIEFVPEPSTWGLVSMGLGFLWAFLRRRKKSLLSG